MNRIYLFLILPLLGLMASCGNNTPPPPSLTVPALKVERRSVLSYDEYPTSIQGRNNNEVRAKISGYIQTVYIDEGQKVSSGQPLFRLETNTLSQNTEAARSGVVAASANVDAAEAVVNAAKIEVDKLKPLVEQNIISPVQLETARANLLRAQGQLSQARAAYQQAKAQFQSAAANEDYSVIRAPVSGVVGKINFRAGALVGPTDPTPITTVSDTRELFAYFSMNEKEYLDFLSRATGTTVREKLSNMSTVELQLANGSIYPQKGKIEAVTGQINPATGSIQFRASFDNKDGWLTNGNSGVIRVPHHFHDVLVVPETSTFEQQGNVFVYVIEKDTARMTKIDVLQRVNNLAIVTGGVAQGTTIVAMGTGKVKNGVPVKTTPTHIDSILNPVKPIFQ